MKKFIYLFMAVASLGVVSCEKDNDVLTGNKNEGGLLSVNTILVPYVVGNGNDFEYAASITAFQGDIKVNSVDIYKTFTTVDGVSSNTALLKTITFLSLLNSILLRTFRTHTYQNENVRFLGILFHFVLQPTKDVEKD